MVAAVAVYYLVIRKRRSGYVPILGTRLPQPAVGGSWEYQRWADSLPPDHVAEVNIPTSRERLFINGEFDTHAIQTGDGSEAIRHHDIALSPGFGVGEGTFGFGRYGSSFMA